MPTLAAVCLTLLHSKGKKRATSLPRTPRWRPQILRIVRGSSYGTLRRPFYTEYAWAFDLLIDRPVEKECGVIAAWLVGRQILPGAAVLDAGCGTGRYSRELARRGYIVHGVDLSPELIEVAKGMVGDRTGGVSFAVADITVPPTARYAAILCRGVLNDIIDDDRRDAVFAAFARALRPHGTLILDVREWGASAERKTREPLFRKRVSTDRGELTFTSITGSMLSAGSC